jgi:ABC-2 type transport system ATP-binding protein
MVRTESGTFIAQPVALPSADLISNGNEYAEYLTTDAATTVTALLAHMTAHDDALIDLRVERPTLEERFLEITQGGE